ncbi:Protein N-acetyltransferase, RimJ/RimL family [Rhizobiales bacterium GAS191]|jgi:RimJ/RimL family protein N-acetyltransferase|nr:Protein N-acetyltransferase, RimJ/RimL family [Rhizobiales bacterium GAS113]SEC42238.1 Protein N-acetyltransferase, RimJ/RimL family [Rhizobiales bacterium GAS191]SEC83769.1 Protein N-acetyltransferase, RimJ/RimL family [Rhizobiales bacterium GAS188]
MRARPHIMDHPSHFAAPAIDTERLTLRGHRLDDFEDSAAMWADAEVTRHITGKPFTREESWTRVLRYAGHWVLLGYGYWVVRERATGRFVGEVGFADYRREIEPSLDGTPETGWVLAPWAHGKGFADEAVEAALAWGAAHLRPGRSVCIIAPDNLASIKLAQRRGYRELRRTNYHGRQIIVFER